MRICSLHMWLLKFTYTFHYCKQWTRSHSDVQTAVTPNNSSCHITCVGAWNENSFIHISVGFWRCYIMFRTFHFLDTIHCPVLKRTKKWNFLTTDPVSAIRWKTDETPYSVGPNHYSSEVQRVDISPYHPHTWGWWHSLFPKYLIHFCIFKHWMMYKVQNPMELNQIVWYATVH